MKKTEEPIKIPDDVAAKCNDPNQFERFDQAFMKAVKFPPEPRKAMKRDSKPESSETEFEAPNNAVY